MGVGHTRIVGASGGDSKRSLLEDGILRPCWVVRGWIWGGRWWKQVQFSSSMGASRLVQHAILWHPLTAFSRRKILEEMHRPYTANNRPYTAFPMIHK